MHTKDNVRYTVRSSKLLTVFIEGTEWKGKVFGELMVELYPELIKDVTFQIYQPNKS